MQIEILALRHQLAVLQRTNKRLASELLTAYYGWTFAGMGAVVLSASHRQAGNSNCVAAKGVSIILALEE